MADQRAFAPGDLSSQITQALNDTETLRRIVFSRPAGRGKEQVQKVTIQPVKIKGTVAFQFSHRDARKVIVKNHDAAAAVPEAQRVLAMGFRSVTLLRSDATLRFQARPDGTMAGFRDAPEPMAVRPDLAHDRQKNALVSAENARDVLSALGFLSHGGAVKPSMQKKLRQVNEFLRVVDNAELTGGGGTGGAEGQPLAALDCGCGNAYLTFALFHFLGAVRGKGIQLTGVDRDPGAVARNNARAASLGMSGIHFVESTIADYTAPIPPDIVLSLHACDTATDEAIARAILWRSSLVLCAPCCHHHINRQLKASRDTLMTRSMARHGVLVEKMGDALTDLFRVLVLSVMGYQAHTIKFVDPDNTERNTLIKGELLADRGTPAAGAAAMSSPPAGGAAAAASAAAAAAQYRDLKAFWNVTPFLEGALGAVFQERLDAAR
jgi:SAM-dependent methyltransferase